MGKRSTGQFDRTPRDYYKTPRSAVEPLLPFLPSEVWYDEPCAGDGTLVDHLWQLDGGFCSRLSDIEPQAKDIDKIDAFDLTDCKGDMFISNPPWSRDILHPLITHLSDIAQTWLLFDSDWLFTKQSHEYMKRCHKIVPVGRVKWIEGSKHTGKDNAMWALFDVNYFGPAEFYGRDK
jgi:hypothetical protein